MSNKFTPLVPLQTAVITRLKAATAVTALCSAIYDAVPQRQTTPYMAWVSPVAVKDRTLGQGGHSGVFHIEIYTSDAAEQKRGIGTVGVKQGLTIAEQVITSLVDPCDGTSFTPLTVTGHDLIDLDVESVDSILEPDGLTRRTTILFTFLLETA